jgi:hypothetical protein
MRESLMYGSVRGARGNSRPYRDGSVCCIAFGRCWHEAGQSLCEGCPQLVLCQEDAKASCCTRDEGRPFGVAL